MIQYNPWNNQQISIPQIFISGFNFNQSSPNPCNLVQYPVIPQTYNSLQLQHQNQQQFHPVNQQPQQILQSNFAYPPQISQQQPQMTIQSSSSFSNTEIHSPIQMRKNDNNDQSSSITDFNKMCKFSLIKDAKQSKEITDDGSKQQSQNPHSSAMIKNTFSIQSSSLTQSTSDILEMEKREGSNDLSIHEEQQKMIPQSLEEAFETVKKSKFFKKSELIFTSHFAKQFRFRAPQYKNDEIVFSKIKEYKKNKKISKQEQKALSSNKKINSKFHNLNKLFMYKLLATFSLKNLEELEVPTYLHESLIKLIAKLKSSTKEMKKYNKKTEFFSHDHYNLLFLHLNEKTAGYLLNSPFSIYLHQICFDLDLSFTSQSEIEEFIKNNQSQLQYINIIKRFCCQIVQNSNMLGVYIDSPDIIPSQRENMRQAYTQRALKGILALNQGVIIRRF